MGNILHQSHGKHGFIWNKGELCATLLYPIAIPNCRQIGAVRAL